jgi:iron(III) transport system permease protein
MSAVTEAPRPTADPSARRPPGRRIDARYVVLAAAAVAVAYHALVPVGTMVVASLRVAFLGTAGSSGWTLRHYADTFTAPGFGTLVGNSFLYAGATAVVSIVVGFAMAWLVTRTNTPAKAFARAAALVPLIVPGILNTVAWALLLAPQQGPLNAALRDVHLPTFDVYSVAGMVLIQSMHVTPIAFLMGSAAFANADSSLEDAALASGATPLRVLRAITLPMIRPAVLSAGLLVFVQTISTFEVPQLIGVPGRHFVFVSRIYAALQNFPPDYGSVGVIGVFVLAIAMGALYASRRLSNRVATQSVTGKGFRPALTDIGRWRWAGLAVFVLYFLVAVALPVAMLLWSSLLPAYRPPSFAALHHLTLSNYSHLWSAPSLTRSVKNSVVTALLAATVVTTLCAVVAYIVVKGKVRGRALLDALATLPIAVPSVVMGVGILYWYLAAPLPVHLYGTLAILVVAFVTISLPYAMRYLVPGMGQIKDELEEAAYASGATWGQTFRRVYVPLLMPSLLAAFVYTTIVAFREISAAIFLYAQGTEVVSVTIFDLWSNGDYPVVAALGVLMVAFLTTLVVVFRLLLGRVGLTERFGG